MSGMAEPEEQEPDQKKSLVFSPIALHHKDVESRHTWRE